ncbi:hypothetical protein FO519_007472 [Halicephalobus sp. NKZ332]|nr:hypothetical protein FO519_007472 [Halicephalobus sp. NKZ332]
MDIEKLLNRRSARKEARKAKKKLAKVVNVARVKKVNKAKATEIADKVRKELEGNDSEEEAYFKELKQAKHKVLKEEIDVDDTEIRKYEKLLGLNRKKTKNVPQSIVEDGLGGEYISELIYLAYKEDIYGRKIDLKTGKVVEEGSTTRALQKLEELNKNNPAVAEERFKIGKALRGTVNRLNERTMVSGIKTVEELFNTSSHNDVKSIFYETFLKTTQTVYALPDRLVMEYAMFIALTHVNVSPEISSHFVESLAIHLVKEMDSEKDSDDKALENATALFCHLYNFKVIKAQFLIDLMTKMRNYAREKTVTLMVYVITYAGTNLKKRAGIVFQNFINESQNFFVKLPEAKKTSKMKFLIEDLLGIKNGVISSITSKFDESQLDYYGKLFKTLIKGTDHKEDELPFSLDDILHISERGRWWVVGSAWKPTEDKVGKVEEKKEKTSKFDSNLMELAKKAKMNTETRRNIFCTILSSEDDMEAFEKLLKLSLKGSQEREIIHISVVCTMMEANYNQYYSILIERFCHYHKRFTMTTQFAIWDRIKELGNLKKRQRINLAFLTADLIQMGALSLAALKVVNFGIIDVTTTAFLRRVFYRLFSKSTNSGLVEMFKKLIKSDGLKLLVDGLRLFFEISMKPESFDEPDAEGVIKKVDLVARILANAD